MNPFLLKNLVQAALIEDINDGDITSEAIFAEDITVKATFITRDSGVIAGLPVVAEIFQQLSNQTVFTPFLADASSVSTNTKIASVTGPVKTILAGERIALNFLQRLSGIASFTNRLVQLVSDYPVKIVDTRKTTPGLRMLEKYAVRQGGGANHRFNLSDAVLIKDNHISACGSVTAAIQKCKAYIPHTMKIEVEVENEAQVREAIAARADIIMLDNMTPAEMKRMITLIDHQAIVEASGRINETTVQEIAATGVDIISVGSLTHSVKAMDISLEIEMN